MAILSGLTTQLTGSAGAWTFYGRLGSTVAKQKVDSHQRRRLSDKQLNHYLRWGNLVSFWAATGGCLRGGFERKSRGQTDHNMFISNNLIDFGVYLTSDMVRAGACVVAPYIVTMGSLPSIGVFEAADGRLRTDIRLGDGSDLTPATTVGELSHAIIDNNDGFAHGDVIFCLAAHQLEDPVTGIPRVKVGSAALRLDGYSKEPLSRDPNVASAFAQVEGFLGAETPIVGGMAWIRMRHLSSRLAVSTQRLVLTGTSPDPYITPEAASAAIASYRPRIPTPLRR